jgi:hypothetical protein
MTNDQEPVAPMVVVATTVSSNNNCTSTPAFPLPSAATRLLFASVVTMIESTTAGGKSSGVAVTVGGTGSTARTGAATDRTEGVAVATIVPLASTDCRAIT